MTFATMLAVSLIAGDGCITPAVSVLGALEGIPLQMGETCDGQMQPRTLQHRCCRDVEELLLRSAAELAESGIFEGPSLLGISRRSPMEVGNVGPK